MSGFVLSIEAGHYKNNYIWSCLEGMKTRTPLFPKLSQTVLYRQWLHTAVRMSWKSPSCCHEKVETLQQGPAGDPNHLPWRWLTDLVKNRQDISGNHDGFHPPRLWLVLPGLVEGHAPNVPQTGSTAGSETRRRIRKLDSDQKLGRTRIRKRKRVSETMRRRIPKLGAQLGGTSSVTSSYI